MLVEWVSAYKPVLFLDKCVVMSINVSQMNAFNILYSSDVGLNL